MSIQKRVKDYQNELRNYLEIEQNTRQMEAEFRNMLKSFAVIKQGGKVTAQVTDNWASVFRATHLAITSARQEILLKAPEDDKDDASNSSTSSDAETEVQKLPDTLVRFPVSN